MKDYKEIQNRLDTKKMPLVFAKHIIINTLGDVIYNLFLCGRNRNTYHKYSKGALRQQRTGNARSVEDCYLIAKEYLPGITLEKVHNAMKSLYDIGRSSLSLHVNYCNNVKRYVHSKNYYELCEDSVDINNHLNKLDLNYEIQAEEAISEFA